MKISLSVQYSVSTVSDASRSAVKLGSDVQVGRKSLLSCPSDPEPNCPLHRAASLPSWSVHLLDEVMFPLDVDHGICALLSGALPANCPAESLALRVNSKPNPLLHIGHYQTFFLCFCSGISLSPFRLAHINTIKEKWIY